MNTKKLIILVAVALAAIGLGIWVAQDRSSQIEVTSKALFPDLKKTINDAAGVRIFTAGDKQSVEIARKDSVWVVTERNDYPADDAKVRKLLLSLANANLREEKTSNPENYASLGVEDMTAEGASGVRIEVAGVTPAINVIVGKQGPGMASQYVRLVGEQKSWLVDTEIDNSSLPQDWLRKSLLEVGADRVQSATIQTKGAKAYTAAKKSKADANFSVEGLPKGKKPSSPSAANPLATALAGLSLSDVQPASAFDETPEVTATYQTFDGLTLELKGWSREDKRYLAAQSRFDEALATRFKVPSDKPVATSAAAGAKDQAAKLADGDSRDAKETAPMIDAAAESKTLNEKFSGWVFEIPEYKYNAIFKPASDLIAD